MDAAVIWFSDDRCRDVRIAGGKGASLAVMTSAALPVPPGFIIPATVFEQSVDARRLRELALAQAHGEAQALVRAALPPRAAIGAALARLEEGATAVRQRDDGAAPGLAVAVRSSACAEDSTSASYAGLQETYLNVRDVDETCRRVVDCWASFFSERALFYRARMGSLADLGMAVVVQRMVQPDKSGVVFTVDPVQRRRDRMVVEAVRGLGEAVVSGAVTPDHYVIDRAGVCKRKMIVDAPVLDDDDLVRLAALGRRLEEYFGAPQDIEWAMAGQDVYLLQSRPITTL